MKKLFYSIFFAYALIVSAFPMIAQSTYEANSINGISYSKQEIKMSLYPLPTSGVLNISFNENQIQTPSVLVYDLLGNLVASIQSDRKDNSSFSIDLSEKKPGYYFVKIQSDKGTISRRITLKP